MDKDNSKTVKAHCSRCGGTRNCAVRSDFEERGGDGHYDWTTVWSILQCLGCDYTFARTIRSNSEDYDYFYEEDGSESVKYAEDIEYWPALAHREAASWFEDLLMIDHDLFSALGEVYGALNNDLRVLAAIGMRTTFDVAAEKLMISSDLSFKRKLEELVAKSHIGPLDKDRLETLVEAGSASAHRGWRPAVDDLKAAMDVLEHFISYAFIEPEKRRSLDKRAKALKAKVPLRAATPRLTSPSSTVPPADVADNDVSNEGSSKPN